MIMESVCIDWRCAACGTVRRIDVADITQSVAGYRPTGWMVDRGKAMCDNCYRPEDGRPWTPPATSREETADALRARMSGLHMGGAGAGGTPSAGQTMTVRGEGGQQSQIHLQGESWGQGARAQEQPAHITAGAGGAGSSRVVSAGPQTSGPSVVVEDTRTSEFLGPQTTVAGVPSMRPNCIGCGMKIQDGTDTGSAEAWRWAIGSVTERGHHACLDKIGR